MESYIRDITLVVTCDPLQVLAERNANMKDAVHGRKFPGRKPGSGSPIRKAVVKVMQKPPKPTKPAAVWAVLSAKPPKGWTFFDNRQGKYIEGPKASDGMEYRRFQNLVAEVRKQGR